jgi:hypothetical protein
MPLLGARPSSRRPWRRVGASASSIREGEEDGLEERGGGGRRQRCAASRREGSAVLYQPGGWRHACASDGELRGWPAGATASPVGHHYYRSVQEHNMFFPVRSVVPVPDRHPSGAAARRRATAYSAPTAAGTATAPKRSSRLGQGLGATAAVLEAPGEVVAKSAHRVALRRSCRAAPVGDGIRMRSSSFCLFLHNIFSCLDFDPFFLWRLFRDI